MTTAVRGEVSARALRGPHAALRVISEHLVSDASGRCLACREFEPCPQRNLAYAALLGTGVLPQRQPMALLTDRGTFDGFGRSTV